MKEELISKDDNTQEKQTCYNCNCESKYPLVFGLCFDCFGGCFSCFTKKRKKICEVCGKEFSIESISVNTRCYDCIEKWGYDSWPDR